MKKRISLMLLVIFVVLFVQSNTVFFVFAEDSVMREVEIFEKVESFDGALHHYNLNDYFEKGEIRYVDYELVSAPSGDVVSLSEKVLTVTPVKSFEGVAKVRAKDRDGEFTYMLFKLRFVEISTYMQASVKRISVILFFVLVLLLGTHMLVCPMKKGTIIFKTPGSKDAYINIKTPFLPIVKTPAEVQIKGFFMGWDECLKFIPLKNQPVYIKDIVDDKEVIVRIKSCPIYSGTEKTTILYSERTCNNGVKIIFQNN